jgi:hypothetical protein
MGRNKTFTRSFAMKRYAMTAVLCVISAMTLTVQATVPADPFAGAWRLQFQPDNAAQDDGAQVFKDAILFHNNQMSAEAFAMYGFSTAAYSVAPDTRIGTATMTSDTQGALQWAVRSAGGQLIGLLVWTKPDGTTHRYSFTGIPFEEDDGLAPQD